MILVLVAILIGGCGDATPTPSAPGTVVATNDAHASGSTPPGGDPPTTPASNPAPTLPPTAKARWTDCGKGFQCATISVPKDYDDLTAGFLDLSLIRLPASDPADRIGSLIVNPGGPGGSGVEFVRAGSRIFPKAIRQRFDLVGFDPRGVNSSSAVRCIDDLDGLADVDPSPDDAKELATLVAQGHEYADACADRNAALLPYLSTAAVVEDLDQIRAAVGDELLTYVGFSYGTLIGSMYADRHPDRIRAMVLDGAIDPSLSETAFRTGQAKAFEASLGRFFAWCAAKRSCAFHEAGKTRQAFDALMAKIDKKPLKIQRYAGRRRVGSGLAFSAVLGAMYDRGSWPSLAFALYAAKNGDGRYLVAISDPFRGRKPDGEYSNQSDAYFSNTCLDFPVSTDVAGFQDLADTLRSVAPHFRAAAYNDLPCLFWPVPPQRTPAVATGHGAPPIVVVGSTGDPATPYAWAKALSTQLESAVLVTRRGDGHTGYAFSTCVQKAVDTYLLDGTAPKDGLVCKK